VAIAEAGEHKRAVALTRSITDQAQQASALAYIAQVLAETGRYAQSAAVARLAQALVDSISDPKQRMSALAETTRAALPLERETAEEEEAVAGSNTDPEQQADALIREADTRTREAVALAKAGDHEHAAAVARSIADPERRATALAEAAVALAKTGDSRYANQLASAACTFGHWTAASPLLLLDNSTRETMICVIGNTPMLA
jgi:hypothetical protein